MLKDEFNNFSIYKVKPQVGLKLDNAENKIYHWYYKDVNL